MSGCTVLEDGKGPCSGLHCAVLKEEHWSDWVSLLFTSTSPSVISSVDTLELSFPSAGE